MSTKFSHVNIISRDWQALAGFYILVFDCRLQLPRRELSGQWVDDLTGIKDCTIRGAHLLLPGYEPGGPTLEIFEYRETLPNKNKQIDLEGFAHIAFGVDDVEEKVALLLSHGGSLMGKLVDTTIEGVGRIRVVYARDPEGNIVEIQKWN